MHKILIDSLSITWKYDNVGELYELLGLQDAEMQPKKTRWYDGGEYIDGVLIAYNFNDEREISDTFLNISGKGCRTVEQLNPGFDWFEFLYRYDSQIRDKKAHISRIDIACDVDDGSITYNMIYKYSKSQLYVSRAKELPDLREMRTEVVYYGSEKSNRLLRIYNKALEQGIPDTDWMRFEFQFRNDSATSWYLNWCEHRDIGKLYAGVMIDFLRFVSPPRGTSIKTIKQHSNQHRLPTVTWWSDFIGAAERIPQLYLPGQDYTLDRLEHYLEHNVASSLKAYMIAHDGDIGKLLDAVKHCKLNAKQKLMLAELDMMRAEQVGKQIE